MNIPAIDLVTRSYAKHAEGVDEVVARACASAQKATSIAVDGQPIFRRLLFLVPVEYDCGLTAARLRSAFEAMNLQNLVILETSGHHSRETLNEGIDNVLANNGQYAVIISGKAIESYLTEDVMKRMVERLDGQLKIIGVNIPELGDVMDSPIQNTFALWDVHALTDHGGFDADNGVEEVAPIIRQLREDLQSVALMEGPPGARLNIRKTGDGQTRHTEVRETKLARQHDEASKLGVPLAFIAENLIHL